MACFSMSPYVRLNNLSMLCRMSNFCMMMYFWSNRIALTYWIMASFENWASAISMLDCGLREIDWPKPLSTTSFSWTSACPPKEFYAAAIDIMAIPGILMPAIPPIRGYMKKPGCYYAAAAPYEPALSPPAVLLLSSSKRKWSIIENHLWNTHFIYYWLQNESIRINL